MIARPREATLSFARAGMAFFRYLGEALKGKEGMILRLFSSRSRKRPSRSSLQTSPRVSRCIGERKVAKALSCFNQARRPVNTGC